MWLLIDMLLQLKLFQKSSYASCVKKESFTAAAAIW